jgi:hypothetical protein
LIFSKVQKKENNLDMEKEVLDLDDLDHIQSKPKKRGKEVESAFDAQTQKQFGDRDDAKVQRRKQLKKQLEERKTMARKLPLGPRMMSVLGQINGAMSKMDKSLAKEMKGKSTQGDQQDIVSDVGAVFAAVRNIGGGSTRHLKKIEDTLDEHGGDTRMKNILKGAMLGPKAMQSETELTEQEKLIFGEEYEKQAQADQHLVQNLHDAPTAAPSHKKKQPPPFTPKTPLQEASTIVPDIKDSSLNGTNPNPTQTKSEKRKKKRQAARKRK